MRRKLKQIKPFAFLVAVSSCSLFSLYFQQHANPANFDTSGKAWVVLSPLETQILRKIETAGIPLKDWNVRIYRGILTGFNDAFIIDEQTKNDLLKKSPKNAEIIRPILRGRDIKRYGFLEAPMWLIFTRHGTDIKEYPSVEEHLQQYYSELKPKKSGDNTGRKPGTYKWYEIQDNVAFYKELAKPKIVWGNLNNTPSFALDLNSNLIASPCVILIPSGQNIHYLLAVLNSSICKFFVSQLSYSRDNGYLEYQKQFIEQLHIPQPASIVQNHIADLVKNVVESKRDNLSTEHTESIIDSLVLESFGLNDKETSYLKNWATAT